ncbi:MAG TPA: hypothetical protein DEP47_05500 [Chloroflexi bacterium]|nr:hypothetical protein [Chloroflexota bacterium]
MKVEIPDEAVGYIVRQDLSFMLASLRADLQRHKAGKWCAVFSANKREDAKQIKATITAFETVLRYYGE